MTPSQDPSVAFLEDLASRGHVPLLHSTSGTIRIDLEDRGNSIHWYIAIDKGNVTVSHRMARADAVVRTDKKLFDGMAKGTVNVTAGLLRGVIAVDGDLGLVSSLARLFPGPPQSVDSYLERQAEKAR